MRFGEGEDAFADRSVEKADTEGGGEAVAVGLDAGEVPGAFENVLGGFEEAVPCYGDVEASGTGESFDNAGRTHAPEEGLIREAGQIRTGVAVEDVLATGDLVPVDGPGWVAGVVVELGELGVGVFVLKEKSV